VKVLVIGGSGVLGRGVAVAGMANEEAISKVILIANSRLEKSR
jgi:hypothetical protein